MIVLKLGGDFTEHQSITAVLDFIRQVSARFW